MSTIAMVSIGLDPTNKKLVKASFSRVENLNKPYKEITGKPIEFLRKFISELKISDIPIRIYDPKPNLPQNLASIIHRTLMNYWRATLPPTREFIEIGRDFDGKKFYASYQDSKDSIPNEWTACVQTGDALTLTKDILETLHNGHDNPVDIEFKKGVPQEVKDLITKAIDLYNMSVEKK